MGIAPVVKTPPALRNVQQFEKYMNTGCRPEAGTSSRSKLLAAQVANTLRAVADRNLGRGDEVRCLKDRALEDPVEGFVLGKVMGVGDLDDPLRLS